MDFGWLFGLIVASLFVLCGLIWTIALLILGDGLWKLNAVWGVVVALVAAVLFTWGAYPPFDMSYHTYRNYSGTVEAVNTRLIAGDHSTNQVFVVKFLGEPGQYRLDDTRGSSLLIGDQLTVRCLKVWQYAAANGYVCNYIHSSEDN